MTLSGNILFIVDLPVEGLSYRGNVANNLRNDHRYEFRPFELEFRGSGSKRENKTYELVSDHILSFNRTFNDVHSLDVTLLYVTAGDKSINTQRITSMASPELKWEKTTGINLGLDFR
jgi:hypothetical protein